VVAFEPVPATRQRLRDNLRLNDTTNVRVEPAALSAQPGRAHMALLERQAGGNHLSSDRVGAGAEVEVSTGDDYWRRTGTAPDVVKVDIEGWEPQFVAGALEMLSARRPCCSSRSTAPPSSTTRTGSPAGRT
jgi:FkbM family methyltransferase